MSFQRQTLQPAQPLRAPIDLGEWEGRAQTQDKRDAMVCPPVQVQPEPDAQTLRLWWFRSQPLEEQKRILAAEQEYRDAEERDRLAAARAAEKARRAAAKAAASAAQGEPVEVEP